MLAETLTLFIMAFALGMDAFSVALGMGLTGLTNREIFKVGLTIGAFHILMPLLGIMIGKTLSNHFGMITTLIGGGLLIFLGLQMIYSSLKADEEPLIKPVGLGLLVFSLTVSLDSFSAGLSLGFIGAQIVVALLAFGIVSMVLTWLGLYLAKQIQGWVGRYGELLGGCILFAFGVKLLIPL